MGALGYGCYMSNEPATVFAFPPSNHPIISVKPRPTKVRGLSPKVPAKATMTVLKTTIMEKTSAREAKKTNVAMRRATTSTAEIAQDIIGRDHKSDSESESESYYSNEFEDKIHINSHQNLIQLQRDRVADARRFVENITNNPDPIEATKRSHMTKVNSNKLKAKERDHALRQESGMYHDSETLQQKLNELQSQLTSLTHSEKTLNTRLNESTIYLTNLAEKKKKLLNNN
ncbi:hypothetical protein ScalyP_jg11364 [Parmales sp. scaly parma]|nr:hypothetical protein ScalyP_jg11364 [Parmales sp. scaly parma]